MNSAGNPLPKTIYSFFQIKPMIKIIDRKISEAEVRSFLGKPHSEVVKFVVDLKTGIMALGGEMHADGEAMLLERESKQENLWGANYYPNRPKEERIEYVSFINIRPSARNFSMEVMEPALRERIKAAAEKIFP